MRRSLSVGALLLIPSTLLAQADGVRRAVESITEHDVRHRIGVLAHDSMRGRSTPSPEIEKTAAYVASQFESFGLGPGGDEDSFIQRYGLEITQLDTTTSQVSLDDGTVWRFTSDVVRVFGGYAPEGASGPTVIATGLVDPEAGLDEGSLEGAVVLYVVQPGERGEMARESQVSMFSLYRQNPAALILVTSPSDAAWSARMRQQMRPGVRVGWRGGDGTPVLMVRRETAVSILGAAGLDSSDVASRSGESLHMWRPDGPRITVTVGRRVIEKQSAPNVVGVLEGSDPLLKNEYIVFSAHMDHVGVGRPVNGDSIYNGADDDASGTAAVIELAQAFASMQPRPKRSMIFLTVSGEERGLWGSDYFASRPPVPIEQIVADLNIDMIGRNWSDTVVVIGKEHSDLGQTLNRVAERHPELDMAPIDDIWPEENFYRRSDHFNFARRGVPVLFFFTGTHDDYHRPSDHAELIDAEKEARIVRLIFYLGLEVANAAERPKWDPESYKAIVGPPVP